MSTPTQPVLLADSGEASELLHTLLNISSTSTLLCRPVYEAPSGTIIDFTFDYLNPAAQQMLGLPQHPAELLLTYFPTAGLTGAFALYRDAFLAGETQHFQLNFQHDGLDGYYDVTTRRQGPLLVVCSTDLKNRSDEQQALRRSQTQEQLARVEAERAKQAALAALAAAEQQHRLLGQILGQVPAAIATLSGPDHRFSFTNEPYQALVANRATRGRPIAEALPELDGQGWLSLLDQVYTSGQPATGHEAPVLLYNPATGQQEQHYLNFICQTLTDKQDRTQGILLFAVDVTQSVQDRQQAETLQAAMLAVTQREAQQREELYQIIAQAPVAIVLLREPAHRIEYYNPAFAEVFPPAEHWPADEPLRGHTLAQVYPRMQEAGLVRLLDKVYTTGESQVVLDMPLAELQPGSSRYVTFSYQPYYEQERIVGVAAFAYDATEQVLARQAQQAQQRELSNLFGQAPMAIVVLRGPQFIIEQANANAELIWGVAVADVLGRPHFEAIPGSAGQGFEELLTGILQTGEAVVQHEVPIELARAHTGQPEVGYYNVIFKPLFDEGQPQATGIVVMWTEATDQVLARQKVQQLNDKLSTTNAQLTRTNVDLDTFVYTASHDLKAPITNIEGLLEALRDELPATVQQQEVISQLLRLMRESVERFRTTINQLTDISRLQHAQNQPAERVPLAAVVEDVRLDLKSLLTSTQAQLTVEINPDITVLFSPKNLRSVVYNLLSNALKYHQPNQPPQVQLRATDAGHQVVLTVTDNGLGLTEPQQQRLFGLFQRLHTHVEGTGVGLYMIKRMIENAGGRITVESQPRQGSIFRVTFLTGGTP